MNAINYNCFGLIREVFNTIEKTLNTSTLGKSLIAISGHVHYYHHVVNPKNLSGLSFK